MRSLLVPLVTLTAACIGEPLYLVGDQAAVIPSFTGEGIAIALRTARLAAAAVLAGDGAERYAAALRRDLRGPLRRSGLIGAAIRLRPLRDLGLGMATLPLMPEVLARLSCLAPSDPGRHGWARALRQLTGTGCSGFW